MDQYHYQQGYGNQNFPIVAEDVITLTEKVNFPIEEYPGYNFVGRLLGPKGSTLKGLQASTKTKMSILGKGSSKDKKKEEELRKSDDPEHAHLKEPLHVLLQVKASKIEAHRKIAAALKELYPFMTPDAADSMPEQMNERPYVNDGGIPPRGGAPPPGRSRGGGQGPPPVDQYGYNDGYYESGPPLREKFGRPGEKRAPASNGFVLKRFRDGY